MTLSFSTIYVRESSLWWLRHFPYEFFFLTAFLRRFPRRFLCRFPRRFPCFLFSIQSFSLPTPNLHLHIRKRSPTDTDKFRPAGHFLVHRIGTAHVCTSVSGTSGTRSGTSSTTNSSTGKYCASRGCNDRRGCTGRSGCTGKGGCTGIGLTGRGCAGGRRGRHACSNKSNTTSLSYITTK